LPDAAPRVTLALSGGGSRAAAQTGMLRAFEERGLRPDLIIGASAGAVNGAWYALHPDDLEALERVWLNLTRRLVFPGTPPTYAYNFVRHGHVHSIKGWRRVLIRSFGDARFEACAIRMLALAVRLRDGEVIPFRSGPIVPALLASTSVPGLFPPQEVAGDLYVDGAVVEYLPLPTAVAERARTVYAFDCSDYPAGDGRRGLAMDRCGQIASTAWVRLVLEAARSRGIVVHHLRPQLGPLYDARDFTHTRRLIDLGYDYASRYLDELAIAGKADVQGPKAAAEDSEAFSSDGRRRQPATEEVS